jgi:hypothetical protein
VYMLSPLSRRSGWAYHSLIRPAVSAFPERVVGSASASSFSRQVQRDGGFQFTLGRWRAGYALPSFRYLGQRIGTIFVRAYRPWLRANNSYYRKAYYS